MANDFCLSPGQECSHARSIMECLTDFTDYLALLLIRVKNAAVHRGSWQLGLWHLSGSHAGTGDKQGLCGSCRT